MNEAELPTMIHRIPDMTYESGKAMDRWLRRALYSSVAMEAKTYERLDLLWSVIERLVVDPGSGHCDTC